MKKNIKIGILIVAILSVVIFFVWLIFNDIQNTTKSTVSQIDTEKYLSGERENFDQKASETKTNNKIDSFIVEDKVEDIVIPDEKLLDVFFVPQAPFHDWSQPWQDACEEAAILGVDNFLNGNKSLSKEQIRDEIFNMVNFQTKKYGFSKDLTTNQIVQFVDDYYSDRKAETFEIRNITDIKAQIAQGNPVILPMYGRELDNPNFTNPGPVYHALVVIGYTKDKIITNDPGTRLGASFEYTYENLYESIHDFVIGANENPSLMTSGRKIGVIIK